MNMTQLAPNFFTGPQITSEDMEILKDEGFTDVVCNRPDAEHPGGAVSSKIADTAKELGLVFHYYPITMGEPYAEQARRLSQLMSKPDVKVFAYCRSGMRAANAWKMAMSDQGSVQRTS